MAVPSVFSMPLGGEDAKPSDTVPMKGVSRGRLARVVAKVMEKWAHPASFAWPSGASSLLFSRREVGQIVAFQTTMHCL